MKNLSEVIGTREEALDVNNNERSSIKLKRDGGVLFLANPFLYLWVIGHRDSPFKHKEIGQTSVAANATATDMLSYIGCCDRSGRICAGGI
jgi:hypothetical protein